MEDEDGISLAWAEFVVHITLRELLPSFRLKIECLASFRFKSTIIQMMLDTHVCYLWHQRPFCKRMSEEETRLEEHI
jgi:hypothetical protein